MKLNPCRMVGRKRESLPTPSNISPKTLQNVTVRGRNYEVPIILNYWTQIKTTPKKIIFLVKSFVELKLNANVYPLNILFGINGLNHSLIGCAITIRKKFSGMNEWLWVIMFMSALRWNAFSLQGFLECFN